MRAALGLGFVFSALVLTAPPAGAQDRVDALIERLERQEREIQQLRQEVQQLREVVPPPPQHPEYRREDGEETLTDYLNPRIRLDVSAQVNPAMNVAGDGHNTKVYFVDNDTTASRVRFAGVGVWDRGPQVGTTLEVGFSPNNSFDVSQDNEFAGSFISVRRAEAWVRDDRYGRVMFGQGSTVADNIAEYDLSLVSGVIMTSGVSFIAGGLQFTADNRLSGVTIADSFQNFDGGRDPRIRYDSPMLGPLQVSASAGANQTYGAALTWGGDYDHWTAKEIGGITTLGGVSIYNPNDHGVDFRVAGSWSMLHDASGISATVASGYDNTGGSTPYSVYGKLGWDTHLFDMGDTGFGVDYSWDANVDQADDEGQSVGLAAVQLIDGYGVQLYSQFRWYTLDRGEGPSFDDIYLGTIGSLVRF
jgi:hypothetical protein